LLDSLLARIVTFWELPVSSIETGFSCFVDQTQTSDPALVTKWSLSIQMQQTNFLSLVSVRTMDLLCSSLTRQFSFESSIAFSSEGESAKTSTPYFFLYDQLSIVFNWGMKATR
jgi:hypothetical protein